MVEDMYEELEKGEHMTTTCTTTLKKTHMRDGSMLYNAMDKSGFEKILNVATTKEI